MGDASVGGKMRRMRRGRGEREESTIPLTFHPLTFLSPYLVMLPSETALFPFSSPLTIKAAVLLQMSHAWRDLPVRPFNPSLRSSYCSLPLFPLAIPFSYFALSLFFSSSVFASSLLLSPFIPCPPQRLSLWCVSDSLRLFRSPALFFFSTVLSTCRCLACRCHSLTGSWREGKEGRRGHAWRERKKSITNNYINNKKTFKIPTWCKQKNTEMTNDKWRRWCKGNMDK